jgi:hypothetical protein
LSENQPPPPTPSLESLRDEEAKFSDVILGAWSMVELYLDIVVLKEYHVSTHNPRSRPLLKLSFDQKLILQKELSQISEEECRTIWQFHTKRSDLSQQSAVFLRTLSPLDKEGFMELAIRAAQIMEDLLDRISKNEITHLDQIGHH